MQAVDVRDVAEFARTVADTWSWLFRGNVSVPQRRWATRWIDPDRERAVLESVR
ncbi:hypothetical protein ACFVZ3_37525 [Kitasatospora purpeofusca]|uniref:hypothetical protein n=1 Tax=Kitasatospora purpeofusca TaxID=67352 RepID=UPI003699779E